MRRSKAVDAKKVVEYEKVSRLKAVDTNDRRLERRPRSTFLLMAAKRELQKLQRADNFGAYPRMHPLKGVRRG